MKEKKQKPAKAKKKKQRKTHIPCPECGAALFSMEDDTLFCKQCGKERLIPKDMQNKLWQDSLSKPGRLMLIILALLLIAGTVWVFIINKPEPALNDKAMDEALDSRNAKIGEITVSLMWDTVDSLELRVITPDGEAVDFETPSAGGGEMDVDSNRGVEEIVETPVENIFFASPAAGKYRVQLRETLDRTPERSANYFIRVQAGETEESYRGTIDSDGTTVEFLPFQYGE